MHKNRSISLPEELWDRLEQNRGEVPVSRMVKMALESWLPPAKTLEKRDKSDMFGTTSGIDIMDGQRTGGAWNHEAEDHSVSAKTRAPAKPYELPKIAPRKTR